MSSYVFIWFMEMWKLIHGKTVYLQDYGSQWDPTVMWNMESMIARMRKYCFVDYAKNAY